MTFVNFVLIISNCSAHLIPKTSADVYQEKRNSCLQWIYILHWLNRRNEIKKICDRRQALSSLINKSQLLRLLRLSRTCNQFNNSLTGVKWAWTPGGNPASVIQSSTANRFNWICIPLDRHKYFLRVITRLKISPVCCQRYRIANKTG